MTQVDKHTNDNNWLSASVVGGEHGVTLTVNLPAVHTLYYAVMPKLGKIIWGERKSYIQERLKKVGKTSPIKQVEGGTAVTFDGLAVSLKELRPSDAPPPICDSLEGAVEAVDDIMAKAVKEMMNKNDKHLVCLSGGTDSLLVAAELKKQNANGLVALSVGASEAVFDVAYAKEYAKELGIPFHFIQIPRNDTELKALVMRTIREYEACDLSNTYMGLCNLLIRDWAEENGYQGIWQGYYADRLLGYSLTMKSNFLKRVANPNDQEWIDYRWGLYSHVTPNDEQVAKTLRGGETYWRSPYLHREMREYVTRLESDIVPYDYSATKPLFETLADQKVSDGSWKHGKKKGYYTGAGVGALAKEFSFMNDAGLKKLHKQIQLLG